MVTLVLDETIIHYSQQNHSPNTDMKNKKKLKNVVRYRLSCFCYMLWLKFPLNAKGYFGGYSPA